MSIYSEDNFANTGMFSPMASCMTSFTKETHTLFKKTTLFSKLGPILFKINKVKNVVLKFLTDAYILAHAMKWYSG